MELLDKYDEAYKQAIAKYLLAEAKKSDSFRLMCQASNKTLEGIIAYIKSEARKQASGNVAMIEDAVVYGWAVHYIEEDSLNFENGKAEGAEAAEPRAKKSETKKSENKLAKSAEKASEKKPKKTENKLAKSAEKASKPKTEKPKEEPSLFGQMELFA